MVTTLRFWPCLFQKLIRAFDELTSYEQLPKHVQEEFLLFFKEYKKLEKKKYDLIQINGFGSVDEAKAEITASIEAYKSKH
jgi:inorganic pyrophosphatase